MSASGFAGRGRGSASPLSCRSASRSIASADAADHPRGGARDLSAMKGAQPCYGSVEPRQDLQKLGRVATSGSMPDEAKSRSSRAPESSTSEPCRRHGRQAVGHILLQCRHHPVAQTLESEHDLFGVTVVGTGHRDVHVPGESGSQRAPEPPGRPRWQTRDRLWSRSLSARRSASRTVRIASASAARCRAGPSRRRVLRQDGKA